MHSAAHTHILGFLDVAPTGWALVGYIAGVGILGALALMALTSVPMRYRKLVVMAATFFGGLFFSLEFLLPHAALPKGTLGFMTGPFNSVAAFGRTLTAAKPNIADWAMVIGTFTLLIGVTNLFQIHGKAVRKRNAGWYNSAVFFVGFFVILILGFAKDATKAQLQQDTTSLFNIILNGFVQTMDATMFSLIAFYIVSAAYRAFRVRSTESALMMITAGVIMLGLVPVGTLLTSWISPTGAWGWLRLERVTAWLLMWPNMAVQRAIGFGLGIGALAMGLRIWLSLERGSFFDRQL